MKVCRIVPAVCLPSLRDSIFHVFTTARSKTRKLCSAAGQRNKRPNDAAFPVSSVSSSNHRRRHNDNSSLENNNTYNTKWVLHSHLVMTPFGTLQWAIGVNFDEEGGDEQRCSIGFMLSRAFSAPSVPLMSTRSRGGQSPNRGPRVPKAGSGQGAARSKPPNGKFAGQQEL